MPRPKSLAAKVGLVVAAAVVIKLVVRPLVEAALQRMDRRNRPYYEAE